MRTPRVIVLHTGPSTDPNVMVGAEGTGAGSVGVSIFEAGSAKLGALREKPGIRIEAPSFDVKLINPLDCPKVTAASGPPPVSWGVVAVAATGSFDGSGVTVAVLDTGIERTHAAFKGIDEIIEEDFTGEGNGDRNGHGTHCAGTICGRDVNGTRIGVARGVNRLLRNCQVTS